MTAGQAQNLDNQESTNGTLPEAQLGLQGDGAIAGGKGVCVHVPVCVCSQGTLCVWWGGRDCVQ